MIEELPYEQLVSRVVNTTVDEMRNARMPEAKIRAYIGSAHAFVQSEQSKIVSTLMKDTVQWLK